MPETPIAREVERKSPAAGGKLRGRMLVLAAALLWSSSGLFAKSPIFQDWPADVRGPMLAFWRAAFAALALLPLVRRPRWRGELVPLGVSFAAMNLTYLSAMALTTAANAIWLQSTAPWWVFLLGVLLLGERMARRDLLTLGFGVLGVGVILFFELRGQNQTGVALGLASGVCYAGVVVCMRRLRHENPAWLVAMSHLVTAGVLLPWVVSIGPWPTALQLLVLAGFGTFQMALPYMLLILGLRSIGSQEAVGLGLIEPVLMPLWVYLAWGETPAGWTLAGAALILTGLVLRYGVPGSMTPGENGND